MNEHKEFYSEEYFRNQYIKREEEKDRQIFKLILKILHGLKPGYGKLLDIGCGDGFFLKMAALCGWEVSGLDNSGFASKYATDRLGLQIINDDAEAVELPKESLDVITMLDVIPHLPRPNTVLLKAKEALKGSGIICIKCIYRNVEFIKKVKSTMAFGRDKGASQLLLPHAFFHFEPETAKQFLHRMGFKVKLVLNINHDRADYPYLLRHPRTLFYMLVNKWMVKLTQPSTHFLIFAEKV